MYTSSIEEIRQLGFKDTSYDWKGTRITQFTSKTFDYGQSQIFASFRPGGVVFELYIFDQDEGFEQSTRLHIQSLEDLKTLIRILTPKE